MLHLTVVHPFGKYQAGDKITDPEDVQAILDGENAPKVVKTREPEQKPA